MNESSIQEPIIGQISGSSVEFQDFDQFDLNVEINIDDHASFFPTDDPDSAQFPCQATMDQSHLRGYIPVTSLTSEFDCVSFNNANWQLDAPVTFVSPIPEFPTPRDTAINFTANATSSTSSTAISRTFSNSFSSGPEFLEYLNSGLHHNKYQLESSNGSTHFNSPIITPASSQDGNNTPQKCTNYQDPTTKAQPFNRKRKPEEMMTSFPSNPYLSPKVARTKSRYEKGRRKEVALSREIGVCVRCRSRKVSFSFPRPCQECVKAAGSKELARCICIRDTLFEIRFGSFDLLFESFSRDFLETEIMRYHGSKRTIHLELLFDEHSPNKSILPLTVQDYSTSDLEDQVLYHRLANNEGTFDVVPSQRYAIIQEDIPSVERLLDWAQVDLTTTEVNPAHRFIIALNDFMTTYCSINPQLPLNDLLRRSVKILKLLHCWRSGKRIVCDSKDPGEYLAPKAVTSQILVVIKEGIREEEKIILRSIEKLMYSGSGPGKHNAVPLWACLWCLILTYRDCMAVYKKFSDAPRPNRRQPGCSDIEMLIGSSKHMYNVLTANYAVLFRISSPLYIDWREEANFELIGRSNKLKDAFYNLSTEVFWFYQCSDELTREDELLKDMIIQQERRLSPRHVLKT